MEFVVSNWCRVHPMALLHKQGEGLISPGTGFLLGVSGLKLKFCQHLQAHGGRSLRLVAMDRMRERNQAYLFQAEDLKGVERNAQVAVVDRVKSPAEYPDGPAFQWARSLMCVCDHHRTR